MSDDQGFRIMDITATENSGEYTWPDVEYGYVAPVYTPSDAVQHLHAMPRIAANNSFDATEWEYIRGLIYITIPFMVVGAVLLLGVLVSMCRCGSGNGYRKSGRVVQQSNRACIKIWSVMLALITIGGCGVAIYGDVQITQGIDLFNDTYTNATDIIGQIDAMSSQVEVMSLEAVVILEGVNDICPDIPPGTEMADTTEDAIAAIKAGSAQVINELENVVERAGQFYTDAEYYQDKLDTLSLAQQIAFIALFALVAVLVIAFVNALFVSPALMEDANPRTLDAKYALYKGCSSWARCLLLPLGVLVLLLAVLTLCASFFLTIGAADFCAAPDAYITAQLDASIEEHVGYYIDGCVGTNPNMKLIEDSAMWLVQAEDILLPGFDGIANCPADAQDDYDDLMRQLNQTVEVGLELVNDARGYVSCRTVNGLYSEAVHEAGCTSVMIGLVWLWSGVLICSVVFAVFMMVCSRYVTTSLQTLEEEYESTTSMTALKGRDQKATQQKKSSH